MNTIQEVKFDGKKPGINFGRITFIFDNIEDKNALRMITDWRDGQEIVIDKIDGNIVVGRLLTNDSNSWLNEKYIQPGAEWFFF